ncbi:unnamed protein product [Phytophthora fragariaefolia]|uniref:Unnamed protein product n=1 Tax=Phytophthora fragariaefolia TaxID=1490495 RepID=A0A9W7CR53_9STRA|nr:unnamed protein product [Phytophthora fragariaefolia]
MCSNLELPIDEDVDADLDEAWDDVIGDDISAGVAAASAIATTDAGLRPDSSFFMVGRLADRCLCSVERRTASVGRLLRVSFRRTDGAGWPTGWPLQFTMFSRMVGVAAAGPAGALRIRLR